jgi:hypothetical protein
LLRSRRTLARTKAAARPAAVGGEARADSFDEGFHLVVVEVIGGGLVGVGGVVVLGGGGGLGGGGDSAAGASRGSGGGLLRALVAEDEDDWPGLEALRVSSSVRMKASSWP